MIAYLGDYLRESGGKRVRPALTILSNYAVGGDGSRYNSIRMATVMEFLHTATLVHDDIIDSADTRRNRPTVNALYGNETAVLMGDWLYMSAFETSLAERSLPILDILTRVTRKMTEGELLQLTTLGRTDVSEAAVPRHHRAKDGISFQRLLRSWRDTRRRQRGGTKSSGRLRHEIWEWHFS